MKNAKTLAETLLAAGFRLVSGGTDNHLMLVDLTDLGITGKEAQETLDRTGITINKNAHPLRHEGSAGDERHPHRHARPDHAGDEGGRDEADRRSHRRRPQNIHNEKRLAEVREEVDTLCGRFPLYAERIRENR